MRIAVLAAAAGVALAGCASMPEDIEPVAVPADAYSSRGCEAAYAERQSVARTLLSWRRSSAGLPRSISSGPSFSRRRLVGRLASTWKERSRSRRASFSYSTSAYPTADGRARPGAARRGLVGRAWHGAVWPKMSSRPADLTQVYVPPGAL